MPYLMNNGKWRAKRMIQGEVKTKVFPTKSDAKKWEAEQSTEAWQSELSQTHMDCLVDLTNSYLDSVKERFSAKTYAEKRWAFRQLFAFIRPDIENVNVTPAIVQAALRNLTLSLKSGNAANRVRKHSSAAWIWGKKYFGLPLVNPFHETEKMPETRHPRYVPPEEDFWSVFQLAEPDDQVFLLTLLHTGARRGEIFRLKWEDVNFPNRTILLSTRKTGHGDKEYAVVPMTAELQSALAEYRMRRKASEYVFINPKTGGAYTQRPALMRKLCRAAGVRPFGFHAIRHLAATILAHAGLDLPTVQAVLRHKNITTTARYIQSLGVSPDKLDRAFSGRQTPKKIIPFTGVGT
ncbi:MAG: site-specific integrase [Desulfovibrio sp.]|jgi:integrase|nr:site-specific integrase [Desulfovibrio sp.]